MGRRSTGPLLRETLSARTPFFNFFASFFVQFGLGKGVNFVFDKEMVKKGPLLRKTLAGQTQFFLQK